jgi:hypothetical protein
MTLAAIDRLVHHATIIEMNVESYRRPAAIERKRGPGRHRRARQSRPAQIDAARQTNPLPKPQLAAINETAHGRLFSS